MSANRFFNGNKNYDRALLPSFTYYKTKKKQLKVQIQTLSINSITIHKLICADPTEYKAATVR
jgi:hypothetical protein